MDQIKYPVGTFSPDKDITPAKRTAWIAEIAGLPQSVRRAVQGLSKEQLDTPYREGGWNIRQIVHHLADSHMNTLIRLKLCLTEREPTITAYNQDAWALTADVLTVEPHVSVGILEGVHARMAALLSSLAPADFARTFRHPERGPMDVDLTLQTYAWHGRHHLAQISALRQRQDW
ncbi:MAG: putative metal-dependent hydrolase [Spirochaetes bacterium]|nr:putative metal-dependent hydrolase [Spirochaetota bacterium]